MPNTVITNAGLNNIIAASPSGPLVKIAYWLPVYDYRADPYEHNGTTTSAINISAAILSGDTTPTGEIIWNIGDNHAYSLTDTDDYIISGGGESGATGPSPWTVTSCKVSKQQVQNLYDGVPLQNMISGTNMEFSSVTNSCTVSGGGFITGVNTVPPEVSAGTDRYFRVVDYYPSLSGTDLAGTFKCRLDKNIGTVKFNKIALYSVSADVDGVETGTPSLFAEAMLNVPCVKTNFGAEGFDDIVIDVQVKFQSQTANWADVFYTTSGDYWQLTPGGLYYPERVGVGTYFEGLNGPQAKLDIRDSSIHQIRVGYDNTHFMDAYTTSTGLGNLSASSGIIDTGTLRPFASLSHDLGSASRIWDSLYAKYLRGSVGTVNLIANMIPTTDNLYDLGSASKMYRNIYTKALTLSGDLDADDVRPNIGATEVVRGYDLGSPSKRYQYVYANNIIGPNDGDDNTGIFVQDSLLALPGLLGENYLGNQNYPWSKAKINRLFLSNNSIVSNVAAGEYSSVDNSFVVSATDSTVGSLKYMYSTRVADMANIYCSFLLSGGTTATQVDFALPWATSTYGIQAVVMSALTSSPTVLSTNVFRCLVYNAFKKGSLIKMDGITPISSNYTVYINLTYPINNGI